MFIVNIIIIYILYSFHMSYSSDHASKPTRTRTKIHPQPHLRISTVDDLQLLIRLAAAADFAETLLEEIWVISRG